ncbi:hypothetical protein KCP70_24730 [Salmonella enterica subsp. enterica]|nr:hypothetical protein KCP70_24730 [Salmonella enterica subsp. enterica]
MHLLPLKPKRQHGVARFHFSGDCMDANTVVAPSPTGPHFIGGACGFTFMEISRGICMVFAER